MWLKNYLKTFKNYGKFKKICEVSDVVNGTEVGRENDDERILVYNVGISIHDIYFASKIYQLMKDNGVLKGIQSIDLKEPHEKFWI